MKARVKRLLGGDVSRDRPLVDPGRHGIDYAPRPPAGKCGQRFTACRYDIILGA